MDRLRKLDELARSLGVPLKITGVDSPVLRVSIGSALWEDIGDPGRVLTSAEDYLRGMGCGLWLAAIRVSDNSPLTSEEAVRAIWNSSN